MIVYIAYMIELVDHILGNLDNAEDFIQVVNGLIELIQRTQPFQQRAIKMNP
jgi:hypothetical protein